MDLNLKSVTPTWAIVLAGLLVLTGCGRQPADSQPAAGGDQAATLADGQAPVPAPEMGDMSEATNGATTAGGQFASRSATSPFANADLALKETYNRALIAVQIGDYRRGLSELDDLSSKPELSAEQKQAVQDLRTQTLTLAPELAASNAAPTDAIKNQVVQEFPVVAPGTVDTPKNIPENPFTTADPAVRETFARAKAAYSIGDYEKALAELKDLAKTPQLNWQQKYAVEELLAKVPQAVPAAQSQTPAASPRK